MKWRISLTSVVFVLLSTSACGGLSLEGSSGSSSTLAGADAAADFDLFFASTFVDGGRGVGSAHVTLSFDDLDDPLGDEFARYYAGECIRMMATGEESSFAPPFDQPKVECWVYETQNDFEAAFAGTQAGSRPEPPRNCWRSYASAVEPDFTPQILVNIDNECAAPAVDPGAELITNGGFETPDIPTGTYDTLDALPGWSLSAGGGIEVQDRVAGEPFEGGQFVEIDADSSVIAQDLATSAGARYTLSFAYTPRPGVDAANTIIHVYWDGALVSSVSGSGVDLTETDWTVLEFEVEAAASSGRLEFRPGGADSSYGGYLDDVSVRPIGEDPPSDAVGDPLDEAAAAMSYFYPDYTLESRIDRPADGLGGEVIDLIGSSNANPGFLILVRMHRVAPAEAAGRGGCDLALESGVQWCHSTAPSGLQAWAGPAAMVPPSMRHQIEAGFVGTHPGVLVVDYRMHSNVEISLSWITSEERVRWDGTSFSAESVWDNDIGAGVWRER